MSSASDSSALSRIPYREVHLPPVLMDRSGHVDGSLGDWVHTSFAQAALAVESIGQWLLDQGFGNRDTVLIISGNSTAHALMRLGTMAAGVTCCPISANYALLGGDFARLRYVISREPETLDVQAVAWDDVMLDWLPWSHVSGSFNLFAAAVFGGSLYIDDGKPAPLLFNETIRNLREVSVPYFCNVPAGFAVLVEALEADEKLRKSFFTKLRMLLYGGAGLPQPVLDRLQTMAVQETGCRIFMTTGYGATETTSGCMAIYWDTDKVGIGLPMPGLEMKLVPLGDRYEVRLREIDGSPDAGLSELTQSPAVQAFMQRALLDYNTAHPASSKKIRRFAFMQEAPSAARHELSDKGTLNQLIAAENRAAEIDELYAPSPGRHVLVV